MNDKRSFLLYADLKRVVDKLPDEMKGKLFQIIIDYANGIEYEIEDLLLSVMFEPIKSQLERDNEKWGQIRHKRSEAGKASANKRQQNSTHVESVEQKATNPTVTGTVTVTDTVTSNKTPTPCLEELLGDSFTEDETIAIKGWLQYKKEKKQSYKNTTSLKALVTQLKNEKGKGCNISEAITASVASNKWSGIVWEKGYPPQGRYNKDPGLKSAIHNCNDQDFNQEF